MRKLLFLVAVSVIGAGLAKADPVACTANTVAFYEANITTAANACSIGGLSFYDFNAGTAGTTSSGPGSSPFNASQIELTPTTGGFIITPLSATGFQASVTGVVDLELPFEVSCTNGTACLSMVSMSVTGSATAGSFGTPGVAMLTETYCPGSPVPPPSNPCGGSSNGVKQDLLTIGPSSSGTSSKTDTFAAVSQLAMSKDIEALGNNGSASITSVTDTFNTVPNTPTPEPASLLLLGSGISGLALLSKRRAAK